MRVHNFADFVEKYGTDTPRMIVGSAIHQPLNAAFQNLLTELLDDLKAASKEQNPT